MTLQRMVDLAGATVFLVIASPVFLFVGAAIYLTDGRPVFYRQRRAGLLGRPFSILKFRTMRINDLPLDRASEIGPGDPLVTPVGNLIRRVKIDELPQLVNVLRGEMALVGPRPRTMEQVANDGELGRHRLLRHPGMTGWAQVNGNIKMSWPERMLLDAWYVDHWSLWLDFKILLLTIGVIAFGEQANRRALEEAVEYANDSSRRS